MRGNKMDWDFCWLWPFLQAYAPYFNTLYIQMLDTLRRFTSWS